MSRNERSGWRDEALSLRHRDWGVDCPATDVDWLEYDHGLAIALIECKHERAPQAFTTDPNTRALLDLGWRAKLPVFAVRYAWRIKIGTPEEIRLGGLAWCLVTPLNDLARTECPARVRLSEEEYVRLLYRLRGRLIPSSVVDILRGETPDDFNVV